MNLTIQVDHTKWGKEHRVSYAGVTTYGATAAEARSNMEQHIYNTLHADTRWVDVHIGLWGDRVAVVQQVAAEGDRGFLHHVSCFSQAEEGTKAQSRCSTLGFDGHDGRERANDEAHRWVSIVEGE